MGAASTLKLGGLETSNNPFSSTREGGLLIGRNIVINADNTAEPRSGQNTATYGGSTTSSSGGVFGSALYVYDGQLWTGGASVGTFTAADDSLLRMKFVQSDSNFYFNAEDGIYAVESSTPVLAGLPKLALVYGETIGPDGPTGTTNTSGISSGAGAGTWIEADTAVAFRMTLLRRLSDGRMLEGPPSDRLVLVNTAASGRTAHVAAATPDGLPDDCLFRVYRTDLSENAATDPGDTMYLVYEAEVGALFCYVELAGNYNALSSTPLYTNALVDGIGQANTTSPSARDITVHGERLWSSNTTSPQRFSLEILGVSSGTGVQTGDTLTIGSTTYTANTDFDIATYGIASQNIAQTAKSLVNAINDQDDYHAYYVSGVNDSPGKILIEAKTLGEDAFGVYGSRAGSWNPVLGTASADAIYSDNNRLPHGLFYSKPDQPEAVPLLNYLLVGSRNFPIKRILPLRDKLFVFKDDGIFTVSGEEPFRVDLLDNTARLIAPDSAVVLNNQIFCFTTQGICTVSDTGVRIISRPIESELKRYLVPQNQTSFARAIFGVASEPDRQYQLWLPTADAAYCDVAYVYNTVTQAWVKWDGIQRTWATTSSTDNIYYGTYTAGTYATQRRNGASDDYMDGPYTITASGFSNGVSKTSFDVTSSTAPQVGDVMYAPTASEGAVPIAVRISAVTSNGGSSYTLTTSEAVYLFSYGTPTCYQAFESEIRWNPFHYGAPGTLKQFSKVHYHFSDANFAVGTAVFSTPWSPSTESVTISTSSRTGWGEGPWGSFQWGQSGAGYFESTLMVPLEKQRAPMLTVGFKCREAGAAWKLHGVTADGDGMSDRTTV